MRLLFIAPEFNIYHLEIVKRLERHGYRVDYLKEKKIGFLWDILHKISYRVYEALQTTILLNSLRELKSKNNKYNILFVIRGEFVDQRVIDYLNRVFIFEKKISYQWDSVKNNPQAVTHFRNNFSVYSFDPDDCRVFGFHYQPLFYIKSGSHDIVHSYDLSFVGVYTEERLNIIKRIHQLYSKKIKIKIKIKINPLKYLSLKFFEKKLKYVPSDYFTFSNIKYHNVLSIMEKSSIVLDISHVTQSGLTMRTIETIGCGSKLLTNNYMIRKEKFYDENMISLYDINDFSLDINAILKRKVSHYEKKDYSIDAWLGSLLRSD
ncbi:hypothetical protein ACV1C8_02135 [Aeromonas hydrophila]|uniref:hypothetical protein n=1 Tax=Aeromonas TaxID=642 RepID=UPI0022DEBD32|nr:hypothetical protein [Aeromonas sp. QDB54]